MLDKNALDKLQAFGKALSADADQTLSEARAEHVASLKAEIDELNAELELMKEQARREVTDLYNTVSPRGMSALDQELDAYWSAHSDQTRPIRRRRDDLEREIDELS